MHRVMVTSAFTSLSTLVFIAFLNNIPHFISHNNETFKCAANKYMVKTAVEKGG